MVYIFYLIKFIQEAYNDENNKARHLHNASYVSWTVIVHTHST